MAFWRKEDPVLKGTQVVKGGMYNFQREWWDSQAFLKAIVAGYGSGKTFIGSKRAISLALQNAPQIGNESIVPHLMVSPSYKVAKRTVIPTIRALLAGRQTINPGLKWKFKKSDHEFEIQYRGRDARIWIGSGDDPDSLKGPNIGSAGIDEPFIQSEEVLDQVYARIRHPNATRQELFLTGTPEQLNWGYDICEGDRKDDFDTFVVHASTRQNVALGAGYARRLEKGFSSTAAQAYVDGLFVNLTGGRVYYGFSKDRNVVHIPDPGHELFAGMDFNVNPMSAVVFWKNGDHIHAIAEIELPNADTDYMCHYLQDTFTDENGKCRIGKVYPDASGNARHSSQRGGKSDFKIIDSYGFEIDAPPSNPLRRDRENAVNGKFAPRSGEATLTVEPTCRKLISYFNKYTYAEMHKQQDMSHLIDAFGYPVHRLNPIERLTMRLVRVEGA